MALYRSEVLPREIPKRFNGVSRQTVEAKVKQLKDGQEDTEQKMPLTRAASVLAGLGGNVTGLCYELTVG